MSTRSKWFIPSLIVLFALTACGGGGGSPPPPPSPSPPGPLPPPPTPAPTVARLEIEQKALLFTAPAQAKQLAARAFDSAGNAINVAVSWSSTSAGSASAAHITVSAGGGLATARSSNGASQIVATAGGVSSAPLLAIVTQAAQNAVLLTDSQIVGDPVETTPGAAPSFGNTYEITLTGSAVPAVGALLINTEAKPVAGRVVAVDTNGPQMKVTLQLVPLAQLFPALEIHEVIDLTNVSISVPDAVAAGYDVRRTAHTYEFTPKPNAQTAAEGALQFKTSQAEAIAADALDCTVASSLPFSFEAPPLMKLEFAPKLDIDYSAISGLKRFLLTGEPSFTIEAGINLTLGLETEVECKIELVELKIPIAGPFSLLLGGQIPVGAGFALTNETTIGSYGLTTKAQVSARLELGIDCEDSAGCSFRRDLSNFKHELTPTIDGIDVGGEFRIEPTVHAFGYAELELGSPALKSLRFDAFEAELGGKLSGSFAAKSMQVLNPDYKSAYGVSLEASASAGTDLGEFLEGIGLESVTAIALSVSLDIARSPAGVVVVNKTSFAAGESLTFQVTLNPSSTNFFPSIGPYNVQEILLLRHNGATLTRIATVTASAGQSEFIIPVTANSPGVSSEFFAFVVTTLAPTDALALEIGQAALPVDVPVVRVSLTTPPDWTGQPNYGLWGVASFGSEGEQCISIRYDYTRRVYRNDGTLQSENKSSTAPVLTCPNHALGWWRQRTDGNNWGLLLSGAISNGRMEFDGTITLSLPDSNHPLVLPSTTTFRCTVNEQGWTCS